MSRQYWQQAVFTTYFALSTPMLYFIYTGLVLGGLTSYLVTAWCCKGVSLEKRQTRAIWYACFLIISIILLVFTIATLDIGLAEKFEFIAAIREVLLATDILNLMLVAIEAFSIAYFVVAAISILSPEGCLDQTSS